MSPRKKAAPFLNIRNNEFAGDMAVWARENCPDNDEQLARLYKNLQLARKTVLTERQQQIMYMYYDEGLTMPTIARELDISCSTVSRSLSRGRARLKSYLRYSF